MDDLFHTLISEVLDPWNSGLFYFLCFSEYQQDRQLAVAAAAAASPLLEAGSMFLEAQSHLTRGEQISRPHLNQSFWGPG